MATPVRMHPRDRDISLRRILRGTSTALEDESSGRDPDAALTGRGGRTQRRSRAAGAEDAEAGRRRAGNAGAAGVSGLDPARR